MNKTYTWQDGGTITAACAEEFVTNLVKAAALTPTTQIRNTCTVLPTAIMIKPALLSVRLHPSISLRI